jgi:hypothetical protein
MGERTDAYVILVRKMKERNNLENPDVDGKKILK